MKRPAPNTPLPVPPFTDFGTIPLCSAMLALPDDAAALERPCDPRNEASGCRFATARDAGGVRYLVLGGVVQMKETTLRPGKPGPFGLRRGDTVATAMAKVKRTTGLALTALREGKEAMLQSAEQPCPGNAYRLIVALGADGLATDVLLTTLPPN